MLLLLGEREDGRWKESKSDSSFINTTAAVRECLQLSFILQFQTNHLISKEVLHHKEAGLVSV